MQVEVGKINYQSTQAASFLSDETISYWAGFGRWFARTVVLVTDSCVGCMQEIKLVAKKIFNEGCQAAKEAAIQLSPVIIQQGCAYVITSVVQDRSYTQLAVGASLLTTGLIVFKVNIGKIRRLGFRTEPGRKLISLLSLPIGLGLMVFGISYLKDGSMQLWERYSHYREIAPLLTKIQQCPSMHAKLNQANQIRGKQLQFQLVVKSRPYNIDNHTCYIARQTEKEMLKVALIQIVEATYSPKILELLKKSERGEVSLAEFLVARMEVAHHILTEQSRSVLSCIEKFG
jgi:hypothetical protein